jgi:hypothetical protein
MVIYSPMIFMFDNLLMPISKLVSEVFERVVKHSGCPRGICSISIGENLYGSFP